MSMVTTNNPFQLLTTVKKDDIELMIIKIKIISLTTTDVDEPQITLNYYQFKMLKQNGTKTKLLLVEAFHIKEKEDFLMSWRL